MSRIADKDIFEALSHSHAVFIDPRGVARIMAAVQGIHAITSIFNQREIDRDLVQPEEEGIAFDNQLGLGLLSALGCCADVIHTVAAGDRIFSVAIEADTPQAKQLGHIARDLASASKQRTA
jgi:hypothetical protein